MYLLHFLLAFAIFFPVVLVTISIFRAYKEDGDVTNVSLFFLLLLLVSFMFTSCSKEEFTAAPTCYSGDCSASLVFSQKQDENGFYHVSLNWNGQYYPRFSILVDAATTNADYWYNGSPVVQATFDTDTTWEFQNDELPIVQSDRILLSKYSEARVSGKRILGPFPPEMKGDTIQIKATVWWEAGMETKGREIFAKFIVE